MIDDQIKLGREIAFQRFKELGYLDQLKEMGVSIDGYNFIVKTLLYKNKTVVGIKREHHEILKEEDRILIIAMKNPEHLKEFNFYVFHPVDDLPFLSGYTSEFQFIHWRLSKTQTLRTIAEYIKEKIAKD